MGVTKTTHKTGLKTHFSRSSKIFNIVIISKSLPSETHCNADPLYKVPTLIKPTEKKSLSEPIIFAGEHKHQFQPRGLKDETAPCHSVIK